MGGGYLVVDSQGCASAVLTCRCWFARYCRSTTPLPSRRRPAAQAVSQGRVCHIIRQVPADAASHGPHGIALATALGVTRSPFPPQAVPVPKTGGRPGG